MSEPLQFFYDVSSPYAYLAAERIDDVLPERPEWCPVAFGVIVRQVNKVPWSFQDEREEHFTSIAQRAADRGLPPLKYPQGWPAQTYSLTPLRALMLAEGQDQLRALSHELFATMFVEGRHLADLDAVLDAAVRAGMDRETVREGIGRQDVKDRLRAQTDDALARGVIGVPTVTIDSRLFWGDDRLEEAAAALRAG